MKSIKNFSSLVLILFSVLVFACYGCKKEGPCVAIITVTDSAGVAVSGAKVILKQDEVVSPVTGIKSNVYQEGITDYYGTATFQFDLEAVLNIEASKGTKSGKDYIRLEKSKTVNRTVKIK